MSGLFDSIKEAWTPDERAAYERALEDARLYTGQRPCPEACGCTEFYDTRTDKVTGGFGVAGCDCERCD